MKKIITFLSLFLISYCSFSQLERIYYSFPTKVSNIINERFEKKVNDSTKTIFLKIATRSDTTKILGYVLNRTGDTTLMINNAIASTNRFFKIGNKDIPILMESDFLFSNILNKKMGNGLASFNYSHCDLYIKFKI